jgi:hypothetical protein
MKQWALIAALCFGFVFCGVNATAAAPPCTAVGTWLGQGDSGFTWMNIKTPGSSATTGQVDVTWIEVDPTLFGAFPDAVRITNGRGVWQMVSGDTVEYTWMAYGLDASAALVYFARVSGSHTEDDCDHHSITYVMELFLPDSTPVFCAEGTANETRMPLVQATCP